MTTQHVRMQPRPVQQNYRLNILLLDSDADYALGLKQVIESRIDGLGVTIVDTFELARKELRLNPNKYFLGIADVAGAPKEVADRIDLFDQYSVSVIAVVPEYEDAMRDQLIKRRVIDYVVKGNKLDSLYVADLIARVHKNLNIKVLVVDDSRVSRFVMVRELMLQKFTVLEAVDGKEALQAFDEHNDIQMMLVDHQLPDTDGCTLVTQMRERFSKEKLLIIGLSTSKDTRLSAKFLKAGANDFIAKPFNYEILLCRMNQNLDMLDSVQLAYKLANTDFLSGLYNRRYFYQQGQHLLDIMSKPKTFTVMVMDIDFFKRINDKHGHDVGDEVIKHFADCLKNYFSKDLVARLGGEEFVVLSFDARYIQSTQEIEAFRRYISQQIIQTRAGAVTYSCSIGVCTSYSQNLDDMLKIADNYLYTAKLGGRNQVASFNQNLL